jgi:hypothetical protein
MCQIGRNSSIAELVIEMRHIRVASPELNHQQHEAAGGCVDVCDDIEHLLC